MDVLLIILFDRSMIKSHFLSFLVKFATSQTAHHLLQLYLTHSTAKACLLFSQNIFGCNMILKVQNISKV